MKHEFNFCYAETSKAIKALGIRWRSSHYWQLHKNRSEYVLKSGFCLFSQGFPAYNITELGHMIPFGFFNEMKLIKLPNNFFKLQLSPDEWATYQSEAEARAQYLIWLVKTGKVVVEGEKKNEFVAVETKPIEVQKPKRRANAKRNKVQPELEQQA